MISSDFFKTFFLITSISQHLIFSNYIFFFLLCGSNFIWECVSFSSILYYLLYFPFCLTSVHILAYLPLIHSRISFIFSSLRYRLRCLFKLKIFRFSLLDSHSLKLFLFWHHDFSLCLHLYFLIFYWLNSVSFFVFFILISTFSYLLCLCFIL